MSCKSCRSKDLTIDDTSGVQVCSKCGVVQDFNNYEHHFGGISGPEGTFVRLGTVGVGTEYSYKERKLYQSDSIIKEITFSLDLDVACTNEVKDMIDKVTAGEFGLGDWFTVLVGACSCIVMRRANKPTPISEVADAVGCELYEMGKMINRVVQFLGIQLPELDIIGMLEKMIRNYSWSEGVNEDKLKLMVEQGIYVLQCMMQWSLTTGRMPGPVAAAVLVFVAKLNGISVKIAEVAKEVKLVIHTCTERYNELLKVLVKVAQKLPWGKDVNVKNIFKNAPFVFKYMEMKAKESVAKKRKRSGNDDTSNSSFNVKELLGECLGGTEYGSEWKMVATNDVSLSLSELENLKISHETLARLYKKFTTDVSMKLIEKNGASPVSEGQDYWYDDDDFDFLMYDKWWNGRSDLCKKLMEDGIFTEKDVGSGVLPPSFVRGCEDVEKRKQKIEAAKMRITEITCQPNKKAIVSVPDANLEDENDASKRKTKKRKTKGGNLDWEDFIIETLLLHQVKEDEIEKGHYNTLLDLHVFNSGVV